MFYYQYWRNNMNAKRKAFMEELMAVMNLDKSGLNQKKWKDFFDKMNDAQFDKWAKEFIKSDKNFTFECIPYKNEPELNDIKNVAKKLGVPLEQYVYFRGPAGDVRTPYPIPTGVILIKKMQQFLTKKNTYATSIATRSMKFNQVTGKDKMAKITEPELFSLIALGADKAIEEFYGPKSDNQFKKDQMYRMISRDGYVYLNELSSNVDSKQTMNIIDMYLFAMGIKSNLLAPGLVMRTINTKDQTQEVRTERK